MHDPSLGTTPFYLSDASQFFELSKDTDIRNEYPNMRFDNELDARIYIEHQFKIQETSRTSFFKAIRIIFGNDTGNYTDKNSILIGFISLHTTNDFEISLAGGFKETLSYGIKSNYRNKGLMSIALKMTLDAMNEDGYNVVAAIVKNGNTPSSRVLEKSGFDLISENAISSFYVKRITMNEDEYNQVFKK